MIESLPSLLVDLALGFSIGLSLGLLGGGGSILTVPALVYIVGQTPQAAISTSLAIVGANSMLGAAFHHRQGSLNWPVALLFGSSGMVTAYLAAGLSDLFTAPMLLVLFAILMLVIGSLMLFQKKRPQEGETSSQRSWPVVLAGGAGVGLLTGLLGVGGGFLIVPALVILVGLPFYQAVGTSLVIIAANSLAGLAGHAQGTWFDWSLTLVFVASGLVGTFVGTRLAHRLPAHQLRQVFAAFVILLGFFLLYDNLPKV